MKKFYQFVEKQFLQLIGFVGVIMITSVIVLTYYEDEKEVLFLEMSVYLNAMEEELVEDNGIYDASKLPEGYEITNI